MAACLSMLGLNRKKGPKTMLRLSPRILQNSACWATGFNGLEAGLNVYCTFLVPCALLMVGHMLLVV